MTNRVLPARRDEHGFVLTDDVCCKAAECIFKYAVAGAATVPGSQATSRGARS